MANGLYHKARQGLLEGKFNLLTDSVKALLVAAEGYTPDMAAHEFLADIPAEARVGNAAILSGKSCTDGAFNAGNTTFSNVTGGAVGAVLLYVDKGSDAQSPLLYFTDTASGLPYVPTGGNLTCEWGSSANKIFRL